MAHNTQNRAWREHVTPQDIEAALYEVFAKLDRLAPSSAATTQRALAMVPDLDKRTRALELGCGCGSASLILAESLPGKLLAVDLHAPFITRLCERAVMLGLADRIDARVADMRQAPGVFDVGPHSIDLVWAEGSLYTIGFDAGLDLCHGLLAPGGVLAVSELVWLHDQPSPQVRAFYAEHYPQMRNRIQLRAALRERGFEVHAEFVLPRSDWDAFYDPLRERIAGLVNNPAAAMLTNEIEIYERFGDEYGYVFFIATSMR
jgi:cyclopropane fatty-acyl-phospholipid synthase-like methyltransferase